MDQRVAAMLIEGGTSVRVAGARPGEKIDRVLAVLIDQSGHGPAAEVIEPPAA